MSIPTGISNHLDRTAGLSPHKAQTIQAWKKPKTLSNGGQAQKQIVATIEEAGRTASMQSSRALSAFQPPQNAGITQSYGFGDIVDVINPLHHVPVVGMVYRGLTGDNLHPASQIIGGAIYGGPIGAVTGTLNAISKIQTGEDVMERSLSFAGLKSYQPQGTQSAEEAAVTLDSLPEPEAITTLNLSV